MKKVRKNATKQIRDILNMFPEAKEYTFENGFIPEKYTLAEGKKGALFTDIFSGQASLYKNDDGWYTVQYHSNYWIDLYPKEEASSND